MAAGVLETQEASTRAQHPSGYSADYIVTPFDAPEGSEIYDPHAASFMQPDFPAPFASEQPQSQSYRHQRVSA